jgi:hypothetical protein
MRLRRNGLPCDVVSLLVKESGRERGSESEHSPLFLSNKENTRTRQARDSKAEKGKGVKQVRSTN